MTAHMCILVRNEPQREVHDMVKFFSTLFHLEPAKKARPVKVGSYNLQYQVDSIDYSASIFGCAIVHYTVDEWK